jgi:hypothetical protein
LLTCLALWYANFTDASTRFHGLLVNQKKILIGGEHGRHDMRTATAEQQQGDNTGDRVDLLWMKRGMNRSKAVILNHIQRTKFLSISAFLFSCILSLFLLIR